MQESTVSFGSHRPGRGDTGLLEGRCKGEDWRQLQYLILQIKESLKIPLAGACYTEEKAGFFLQQSNPEIPVPLAFASTSLLRI